MTTTKAGCRLGRIWQTSSDGSMTANCKCGHRLGIYWLRSELATAYAAHVKATTGDLRD